MAFVMVCKDLTSLIEKRSCSCNSSFELKKVDLGNQGYCLEWFTESSDP